eukprot:CAMPEP_0168830468 /NCGR_PEP_ID=MMETSP0727-20121128/1546_1 /TAXON_ID=265536 /ORGANISM="Amphiprora sp., Strain CCMP467" /LENGTH=1752 /DNA_ID=CAMNT_0008883699 /DNA_START=232 /DNA_END=5491 /DNA_ORIENTATION=-
MILWFKTGAFALGWLCILIGRDDYSASAAPDNDLCVNATEVDGLLPFREDSSTALATTDGADSLCRLSSAAKGVWYSMDGTGNWATVRVRASYFYGQVVVYKQNDLEGSELCEDLLCHRYSQVGGWSGKWFGPEWFAEIGETYKILITAMQGGRSGDFTVSITDYDPPAGDICQNATEIPSLPFEQDGTSFAATYDEADAICGVEASSRGIWYTFQGTGKWTSIRYKTAFQYKRLVLYKKQGNDFSSCDDLTCVVGHVDGGDFDLDIVDYDPPVNNECKTSAPISLPFKQDGTTTAATYDTPDALCGVEASSRGVWYSFVGTGKMTSIRYKTSFRYKRIVLYEQGSSCDELTCIGYTSANGDGLTAERELLTKEGVTYQVLLTGYYNGNTGDFDLDIVDYEPPANNNCTSSKAIPSLPFQEDATTFGSLFDQADAICGVEASSRGVWYMFVGGGKWTSIKYTTSFRYKRLVVYKQETSCAELTCVGYSSANGDGLTAERQWLPEKGVTYQLLLTGYYNGNTGDYGLDIAEFESPIHDTCAGSIVAPSLPFEDDGSTTTALYDEPDAVCGVEASARGVWYSFNGTGTWITIRYTTSFYYKHMALYNNQADPPSCDALTCMFYTRGTGYGTTSSRQFVAQVGATYNLLLTGYNSNTGDYGVDIIAHDPPVNDKCENAIVSSPYSYEDDGDATWALYDGQDGICRIEQNSRGVWYSFVGDGSSTTITYSTQIRYKHFAVYTGSCDNLICETYVRRPTYSAVSLTINTQKSEQYYILVTTYNNASPGDYKIIIKANGPTPPPTEEPTTQHPTAAPTSPIVTNGGLYGTSGYSGSVAPWSDLYSINPQTGAASLIGPILVGAQPVLIDGLSYDKHSGRMIAHSSIDSPHYGNSFLAVNTVNGRAKVIGTSNLNVTGLAVRSNGVAYSWTADGEEESGLVLVSTFRGYTAVVGSSGIMTSDVGLAFDSDDVLHLLNNEGADHFLVNVVTGSTSISSTFEPLIGTVHGDIMPGTSLYFAPSNDDNGIIQLYDLGTSGVQSDLVHTGILSLHTLAFVEERVTTPTDAPTTTPTASPTASPTALPTGSPTALPTVTPTRTASPSSSFSPTEPVLKQCSIKEFTVVSSQSYDALVVDGTLDKAQVKWSVAFASTLTTFEYSIPYRDSELNESDDIMTTLGSTLPNSADGISSFWLPDLSNATNGCANQASLKVTIPRSASVICFGSGTGKEESDACRPTLCPLGSSSEQLKPDDITAISFAPGNAAALFGTSESCKILKPEGWHDYWNSTASGDEFDQFLFKSDEDGDGASNIVEFYGAGFISSLYSDLTEIRILPNKTDPFNPDSDGDLLLDSFELFYGLDPLVADSIAEDLDGDTLDTLREQIYKTNPFSNDTDNDGVDDAVEISQGTDPLDSGNFIQTTTRRQLEQASQTLDVTLTVGDPSGSNSERYSLKVGPVEHQAPSFGVVSTGTYPFKAGTYIVKVSHRGSNLQVPDYDYTASISVASDPNWEVIIDDPSTLLGTFYTSSYDRTIGKTAMLVLRQSDSSCSQYTTCTDCAKEKARCFWSVDDKACNERASFLDSGPLTCPCTLCSNWFSRNSDRSWMNDIPKCPCKVDQVQETTNYIFWETTHTFLHVADPEDGVEWSNDDKCNPEVEFCTYHPGAYGCLRGKYTARDTNAGQQCCYNTNRELIRGGRAAGTPDIARGGYEWTVGSHWTRDVIPYKNCCLECEDPEFCSYYLGGTVDGKKITGAREDTVSDCSA